MQECMAIVLARTHLDVEVSCVEEVADPLVVSKARLGLRQLVIMVRELEVNAARVYVHVPAETMRHTGDGLS